MKKKIILACAFLVLCGCTTVTKKGSVDYENKYTGTVIKATVEMNGDDIVKVSLDETYNDTTKRTIGKEYGMKGSSSIGREWYEQIDFIENYIEHHGLDALKLNENGYAMEYDVLGGCTINLAAIKEAVNQAVQSAK